MHDKMVRAQPKDDERGAGSLLANQAVDERDFLEE